MTVSAAVDPEFFLPDSISPLAPFLAFCHFFILYPQAIFRKLIVREKSSTLLDLEHQIAELDLMGDQRIQVEEFERYKVLAELYDSNSKARNLPLDLRTVGKLLSSLTIPVKSMIKYGLIQIEITG